MRPLTSRTYLGVDVLDGPFDSAGLVLDTPARRITVIGPGPGAPWVDAHEAVPRYRRTLRIWNQGPDDLADLIGWLDARRGRALPFWLPSWDADLTLWEPAEPESGIITVYSPEDLGYHALEFPAGPSRRHLLILAAGIDPIYCRVTAIEDHSGGAAALALDDSLAEGLPLGARISFLRWCRQDVDEARILFHPTGVSECDLPIIEIPQECPA